ncbi:MAG TPA: AAA family ATPase [Caulifigura sp.]|nr:AAA family ATPase [Caulifigura sp.]
MSKDPFEALREALRHSPENIPLRLHLAESLLERGLLADSEAEFRKGLQQEPSNSDFQLGLARAFLRQEKLSEAFVVVEQLMSQRATPAAAYILHARLLLRIGDVQRAVTQYKMGIQEDPEVADEELASRLGVSAGLDTGESELVDGRLRATNTPPSDTSADIERPKVNFSDVGGMEALKEEIRLKIIYPLQHAEMYAAYGKPIGGGILMYGPPGCGKTHLARATAGEIQASFLPVGINDVLDMWIGNSERNLHAIFEQARRTKPCVLFFDEVDALGARRSDMLQSAGRHLINQFLSELDGVSSSNDGVLILAATNAPWHLDPAFRRPGRFDRVLFVPPPDLPAREQILKIMLSGKPAGDLDLHHIAAKTDQFSGADLKGLVDRAIEDKLAESMKTGRLLPLATKDLVAAAKKQKPTTLEWFASARNHALYSNQGGVYDDILKHLKL